MLEVGTKAPDFELFDQDGKLHKLNDYIGKKVILYLYSFVYQRKKDSAGEAISLSSYNNNNSFVRHQIDKLEVIYVFANIPYLLVVHRPHKLGGHNCQ